MWWCNLKHHQYQKHHSMWIWLCIFICRHPSTFRIHWFTSCNYWSWKTKTISRGCRKIKLFIKPPFSISGNISCNKFNFLHAHNWPINLVTNFWSFGLQIFWWCYLKTSSISETSFYVNLIVDFHLWKFEYIPHFLIHSLQLLELENKNNF